jgi:retinol-binding protein 3
MKTLCRLLLLIGIGATSVGAQSPPAIPDTPAGHTLRAWLDAFNSGDRIKIENYVKTIDPEQSVDGMIAFLRQTGGFELLSIESSDPTHIRFRVKEKNGPTTALGNLLLTEDKPPTVGTFGLRALPPGAVPVAVTFDAQLRRRVIDGINAELEEFYIDVALAKQMRDALERHSKAGEYESITDGDAFAAQLTKDLRAVSHDRHLNVAFSPFKVPEPQTPSADDTARMREGMKRSNCTFEKVEVLSGNIGYVKFNAFMNPDICAPTVVAAMGFLANTDSVIFDLRDNGGGDPAMVTFIASYLFDKPTHLNDLYNRKEDSTHQFWTLSYVPGERLAKQSVFVLTSKRTFSGAEEFTYDLKNQKRATVVGETTGGGAHPVTGHVVADYFMVGVPFAKAVNPVSKTNWEGTGVEPDVKVSAAEALATAVKLAAEKPHPEAQKQK